MARKNTFEPQVHPVTDTMNVGTQVGRLVGKLNIAFKEVEKPSVPSTPVEPIVEYLVLDGNGFGNSGIFDGNLNIDE